MADQPKWDELTAKAQEFVQSISGGDPAKAFDTMNEPMRQALPPDALRQLWTGLQGQTGPFGGLTGQVKTAVEEGYSSVYLEGKFERTPLWFKIVYDKEQVAGLQFVPGPPP